MKRKVLFLLSAVFTCCLAFAGNVQAQDFYGEGNVLIAVDMAPYAENEEVNYPENTMGTLIWGDDAPTGESTRPVFNNKTYIVPEDVTVKKAEPYELEMTYTVGQKMYLPFSRNDDPDCIRETWYYTADKFSEELFSSDGKPLFTISRDMIIEEDGMTKYGFLTEKGEDGKGVPCVDFLEIECLGVFEHATLWRYTGNAVSERTGFDIAYYMEKIELSDEDIRRFGKEFDAAYDVVSEIYADPKLEDEQGDRDAKVACVMLDQLDYRSGTIAYYNSGNTDYYGFDCIVAHSKDGLKKNGTFDVKTELQSETIIHELNHYSMHGLTGTRKWDFWFSEAMADSTCYSVIPESTLYRYNSVYFLSVSPRIRMMPGTLWGYEGREGYPYCKFSVYSTGALFFRYIDRMTTGSTTGRIWTDYIKSAPVEELLFGKQLDKYLKDKTGESLDYWMAQFMAAVVVGDSDGRYCMGSKTVTDDCRVDPYHYFRPYEDYGNHLGVLDETSDYSIRNYLSEFGVSAISGGGTTYAYRNDAGGKIAITGADDRWYFFAVNMELPDPDEKIRISSAEEMRKIGNDPAYPLGGSYILTKDLDLGGKKQSWIPIGKNKRGFFGEFDGNGHEIRGMYIRNDEIGESALFGMIEGNAVIKDLTVYGTVIGDESSAGIVGYSRDSVITGCTSYVRVKGTQDVGGIVGYQWCGSVSKCINKGEVTGETDVGGIAGYCSWTSVRNCENEGRVNGDILVGGIAGYNAASRISGCKNTADVYSNSWIGGICGISINENNRIYNCLQTGNVSGNIDVGGIVGGIRDGVIKKCIQKGKVSGENAVGLIAGKVVNSELKKNSCDGRDLPVVGLNNQELDAA